MTYASWTEACATYSCQRAEAVRWNIANETRIPEAMRNFRDRLGELFANKTGVVMDAAEAAHAAVTDLVKELKDEPGKFGGMVVRSWTLLPDLDMVTHITWRRPLRHKYVRRIRADAPQPLNPKLQRPYMTKTDGSSAGTYIPVGTYIWATFEVPGMALGDDPTFVVCALGLDHPPESGEPAFIGDFLYRFRFRPEAAESAEYCIPSCLDACCNPAWAPPPADHPEPWGLTPCRVVFHQAPGSYRPVYSIFPLSKAGRRGLGIRDFLIPSSSSDNP
jgi:hypothetical protein